MIFKDKGRASKYRLIYEIPRSGFPLIRFAIRRAFLRFSISIVPFAPANRFFSVDKRAC